MPRVVERDDEEIIDRQSSAVSASTTASTRRETVVFDEDYDDESDEPERPNLYAILGGDRAATTSEIARAYRAIAIKHHPDRRRGRATTTGQDDGDEKFVEAQAAYEILKDDAKREFYDAGGSMAEMVRRAT